MALKILTILFIFLSIKASSQDYVATWSSKGHTKYIIQKSSDNKSWSNVATINAKITDTSFSYTLPATVKFNYYKIVADTYQSQSIYVTNITPTISIQLNYEIKLK